QPRQVVPDNMVVVHPERIKASGSYDLPFQPVRPFWALDYLSKHTKRKDYDDNRRRYEHELKVPYYLLFDTDEQELMFFRRGARKYVLVKPNEQGRYTIPQLEMEIGLQDGWVRYWYKGERLSRPAELLRELEEVRRQIAEARRLRETLEETER